MQLIRTRLKTVGDMNNQAVCVAGNVEDEAIATHKIDIGPKHRPSIGRPTQSGP
jgi:hypothetical protein